MKNLSRGIKPMCTSIFVLCFAMAGFAQSVPEKSVAKQNLINHNVIQEGNDVSKVKSFSNIDLSKYGVANKEVDVEALKKYIAAAESPVTKSFDCSDPENTKPLLLKKLNQIDTRVFDVTNNQDVNLSLFGIVSGGVARRDKLLQANFWVFKDYPCVDKTYKRALVGMTLYLKLSNLKVTLSSLTLPNISAAAQLGKATASFSLKFYGVTEAIDFKNLPSIGDLNFDNYSKIISAWDKIVTGFNSNSVVDPVIVPNILAANP